MAKYLDQARAFIPPLGSHSHKGQAGKIAVLGGCREYTGAPYYSAISSLKVGCDLSHIFCAEAAGTPIKSYSPEIIVHPTLQEKDEKNVPDSAEKAKIVSSVTNWFQAIHSLVVGPGLGRDSLLWETTSDIILRAKEKELPIVLDGDGIGIICSNPKLISGYKHAILTPNVVEYKRLCAAVFPNNEEKSVDIKELANKLGNVTIVQKGKSDIISDGREYIECEEEGGPRRCGGQGDMLTGCISTFVAWAVEWAHNGEGKGKHHEISPIMLACFAACSLSRRSANLAYQKHRRSTTTPDMISEIGEAFETLFPGTSTIKN